MFAFAMMGVAPANAVVDSDFGLIATPSATTPGRGTLTIAIRPGFPAPVTVSVIVVGTGGTLAGGTHEQPVYEQLVELTGTPVSVDYLCVGSSMELGVMFLGKGGSGFPVMAPCGAVVAPPPAPVWNQSATITVGAPGSGNASVALTNKSNAPAVYAVYEGDKELPGYTVGIGETVTDSLSGLTPGKTLFVYGIKDGSAPKGQPLAQEEIPEKFDEDVPPADDTPRSIGVCTLVGEGVYVRNALRIAHVLATPTDGFGRHVVPSFEYEWQGVKRFFEGRNWTPENQALYANGCKTVAVVSPEPDDSETPASPVVSQTPVADQSTVPSGQQATQSGQPAVKVAKKTGADLAELTFNTGATSSVVATQADQQQKYWEAGRLLALAGIIIIIAFVFRRRTAK
jgi:hypothetical protein